MSTIVVPSRPAGVRRTQRSGGAVQAVIQVVLWAFIAFVVLMILAAVAVPRLLGATPYTILTGSMSPTMPPGTLVVVKPVAVADLRVGDAVTYQLVSGRPTVVTHRIVAVRHGVDGKPEFRTQGDANPVADARWVRPVQLKGRVLYAVPALGRVNQALTPQQRRHVSIAVATGLLGYAGIMVAGAVRDRSRRRTAVHR